MKNKIKIKKGDEVIVIAGKNKGKTGKILSVFPKIYKVKVSGVNLSKRHTKPNPNQNQTGGIIEKEMPIHISNVLFYDKDLKKGTKIGAKYLKDNTKVRMNRKTNKEIG